MTPYYEVGVAGIRLFSTESIEEAATMHGKLMAVVQLVLESGGAEVLIRKAASDNDDDPFTKEMLKSYVGPEKEEGNH